MIISYILQGILAVLFLSVGVQKVIGDQLQVDIFKSLKLPQSSRVVTGWLELIGVGGVIIGFWLPWLLVLVGLWFAVIMLVGMMAHARVKDPFKKFVPAFMLLVVSIILSTLHFSDLEKLFS